MTAKEELDRCTEEQLDKIIYLLGIVYHNGIGREDKVTMILANASEENIKELIKKVCCKD